MSEVRNIFDRWQRLESEKAALSEDLKELFVEAKSRGFNPKALRLAFRQRVAADKPVSDAERETSALVDQYLAELGTSRATRAPAPARQPKTDESTGSPPPKPVVVVSSEPADNSAPISRECPPIPAELRRA